MSDNYGYIYCMANKCMNGIVKIGITNNNPLIRAKQLFNGNTSIPCEFEVKFSKKVKNPKEEEKNIHNMLRDKRYPRREFFEVSEEEVRQIFSQIQGEWWDEKYDDNQNEYIELEDTSSEDAYDEPNEEHEDDEEEEEEDDPMTAMAKQQKQILIQQKITNNKKHFELINGQVKDLETNKKALIIQIKSIDENISKMKNEAYDKANEDNKSVQQKLDKVLAFLGERQIKKTAERKSSAVKAPRSDGGKPYTKPLGLWRPDDDIDLCNTTTRFIFKVDSKKYNASWCCYCLIDKQSNKIYECDENNTRICNENFVSLNKFCYMVKSRVKFGGSMKQNIYDAMKYYDVKSSQYSSLVHITEAVN